MLWYISRERGPDANSMGTMTLGENPCDIFVSICVETSAQRTHLVGGTLSYHGLEALHKVNEAMTGVWRGASSGGELGKCDVLQEERD